MLVISHDRDLLDDVADHILHLERGKLTLMERRLFAASSASAASSRHSAGQGGEETGGAAQAHLQSFVDRFRAKATKAAQAQSRLKMLAKMEPVAAIVDEHVLPFRWPPPRKPLSPPIVAHGDASASAMASAPCCRRLDLTLAERRPHRPARLQRQRQIDLRQAARRPARSRCRARSTPRQQARGRLLRPASGRRSRRRRHALQPCRRAHARRAGGEDPRPAPRRSAFRARAPTRKIGQLSGGEKARLLMGLATFDGPQLLILDEPTNHLDIDSRAELIEAINDYEGACILVSHDRRLLEACVDRLWLVADGTVQPFDGDVDDYSRFVLGENAPPKKSRRRDAPPSPRRRRAARRGARRGSQGEIAALEAEDAPLPGPAAPRRRGAGGSERCAAAMRRRSPISPSSAANSKGRWRDRRGVARAFRAGRGAMTAPVIAPTANRRGYRFAAASWRR